MAEQEDFVKQHQPPRPRSPPDNRLTPTPLQTIVGATLADLSTALSINRLTSVELTAKFLLRLFTYDSRGPCLTSIPLLNPQVFIEAAASDARRLQNKTLGPLDGIPYTVKDSMKYRGMTCATGSPAIRDLVANEDAFIVERLRAAGAVCLGRTNTPPFMASGMHRGLHGRAESAYNPEYLTAAFSSGSSNGSGTSTAASFAAFGLGSETVSSGRSPASNNALVAYTPSRGVISPRGIWPLYPTCDVVVPHTRTVADMLTILDVVAVKDERSDEDFWRQQTLVKIPAVPRPKSFLDLISRAESSFNGKRVAVPKMFVGGDDPKPKTPFISQEVIELYQQAKKDLEALGAKVIETDFPLVTNYEDDSLSGEANNIVGFQPGWNTKERRELVAYTWDDFLRANNDPDYPSLSSLDGTKMFPRPDPATYPPDRYIEQKNFMDYPALVELARTRNGRSIWELDGIAQALPALEAQRKRDLEDWMDDHGIDVVAFPANGDVGKADVDINDESARHALLNGVKYSFGNRALRHLGVPTVSLCMGFMATKRMPVNITFAGKHGSDAELLRYAFAFEKRTGHRVEPPVTPVLESDWIRSARVLARPKEDERLVEFELVVHYAGKIGKTAIRAQGEVVTELIEDVQIEVFLDGRRLPDRQIIVAGRSWSLTSDFTPFMPAMPLYGGLGSVVGNVNIIVLARVAGRVRGQLITIPQSFPGWEFEAYDHLLE